MRQFEYKELDDEGMETLEAISAADKFNSWMYEVISPYCSGKILEIGSGIGNISQFFYKDRHNINFSDIRNNYREILSDKFKLFEPRVYDLNLVDPEFESKNSSLIGTFDTVFALNVVEHIDDDSLALLNCHSLLKSGGNVVILVPSYEILYNVFDKTLGHVRRYNKEKLKILVEKKFKVIHSQ